MREPGNHKDREVFSNLTLYSLQSKDLGVLDTIPKPLQTEADSMSVDIAGSRLGMGLYLPPWEATAWQPHAGGGGWETQGVRCPTYTIWMG